MFFFFQCSNSSDEHSGPLRHKCCLTMKECMSALLTLLGQFCFAQLQVFIGNILKYGVWRGMLFLLLWKSLIWAAHMQESWRKIQLKAEVVLQWLRRLQRKLNFKLFSSFFFNPQNLFSEKKAPEWRSCRSMFLQVGNAAVKTKKITGPCEVTPLVLVSRPMH